MPMREFRGGRSGHGRLGHGRLGLASASQKWFLFELITESLREAWSLAWACPPCCPCHAALLSRCPK
eukprot:6464438-Pyramimonas_sp.AAC.1